MTNLFSDFSRLYRSTLFWKGGQLLFGIVVSIVTARMLGAEGRGLYSVLLAYLSVFAVFVGVGIPEGTVTEFGSLHDKRGSDDTLQILRNSLTWGIFSGGILAILIVPWLLLYALRSHDMKYLIVENRLLIFLLIVGGWFKALSIHVRQYFVGLRDLNVANRLLFWEHFFVALGILVPAALNTLDIALLVGGLSFGSILGGILHLLHVQSFLKSRVDFIDTIKWLKTNVRLFWTFYYIAILGVVGSRLALLISDQMLTIRDVGLLSVAMSFSNIIVIIQFAGSQTLFSFSASISASGEMGEIWNRIKLMSMISIFAWVLGATLIPFVVPRVFGQDFREAIAIAQILLASSVFVGINSFIQSALLGRKRMSSSLINTKLFVGCQVILGSCLCWKFGLFGLCLGQLTAAIITSIHGVIVFYKLEKL